MTRAQLRTVLRPWIDKAIGQPGTVTFEEWEQAVDAVLAACAPPAAPAGEMRPCKITGGPHRWDFGPCLDCGAPATQPAPSDDTLRELAREVVSVLLREAIGDPIDAYSGTADDLVDRQTAESIILAALHRAREGR